MSAANPDVGSPCIDRDGSFSSGTKLAGPDGNATTAAEADGNIDTCYIYPATNCTEIEYASFIWEGGSDFSTRDDGDTEGDGVSANSGECTTHTAPTDFTAFAIEIDDLIGANTDGSVERSGSGGEGARYTSGVDNIPCTSVTFNYSSSRSLSIGADEYVAAGGLSIPIRRRRM